MAVQPLARLGGRKMLSSVANRGQDLENATKQNTIRLRGSESTLACLQMLTVDACVAPNGDLVGSLP